jgi:hypothetical protein
MKYSITYIHIVMNYVHIYGSDSVMILSMKVVFVTRSALTRSLECESALPVARDDANWDPAPILIAHSLDTSLHTNRVRMLA